MKINKFFLLATLFAFTATFSYSKTFTFIVQGVPYTTPDLPDDISALVENNHDLIQTAITDNNVTASDLNTAIAEVKKVYDEFAAQGYSTAPLTTTTDGLNAFSKDMTLSIANSQLMQNIWPEAWIGKLIPGLHMGIGANVGVSQMSIKSLKEAAKALRIDGMNDFPDTIAFPTVAVDARVGGIFLPFDIGVSFMTIDSTKISSLNNLIKPVSFDFYTFGVDARWAILQGEGKLPKFSVGAGFTLTKGNVGMKNDEADAGMKFNSKNIYVQTQLSKKLLFFVPFVGAKFSWCTTSVNWNATAQWNNILDGDAGELGNLQDWGIMPTNFSGGHEGSKFIPQVFGGFGLDFFIVNINFAVAYDIPNQIASGAFSFRIAW